MAFACEAIISTLDVVIVDYGLEKLEMKLGVLQVDFYNFRKTP